MKILGLSDKEAQEYINLLAKIESNNNPNAKAKTSSASGLFQPIKSTWESYGYDWKDVFNVDKQYEFAERFTNDNAAALKKAGCAINFATLYGAHFLGVAGFLKIMRATPSTPIAAVTTAAARKANPSILKGTVKDFTDWLEKKTGHHYTRRTVVTLPDASPAHEEKRGVVGFIVLLLAVVAAVAAVLVFKGN